MSSTIVLHRGPDRVLGTSTVEVGDRRYEVTLTFTGSVFEPGLLLLASVQVEPMDAFVVGDLGKVLWAGLESSHRVEIDRQRERTAATYSEALLDSWRTPSAARAAGEYAAVALAYEAVASAGHRNPLETIAGHMGCTLGVSSNRVSRARSAGYLLPTEPGLLGAVATDAAREDLDSSTPLPARD